MAQAIHSIKRRVLGPAYEIPEREDELKASAIFNRRTHLRDRRKWEYLESVIECAVNFPVVSFFVVMERPQNPEVIERDRLPHYVRFLLMRIDAYVAAEAPATKAMLIFDSRSPGYDRLCSQAIGCFLFRHPSGTQHRHILETPLFVESSVVPGIQIADYFASAVRQHHEQQTGGVQADDYRLAAERLYRSVKRTAKDTEMPDGRTSYGEYIMDSRWFGCSHPGPEREQGA
jgi:hypothetical protein